MTDGVVVATVDTAQAAEDARHLQELESLERVIANELQFKKKLGVGEAAFPTVMIARKAQELAGVAAAAATGAGAAASATVAGTFFATGWMTALGLGAFAVTPIGWVVGAAVVTGGAYYGVSRLIDSYCSSRVDKIPHFLNSNIDILGVAILDALGAVALRLAAADGVVSDHERGALHDYFVDDWGFDSAYARVALRTLEDGMDKTDLAQCVRRLTEAAMKHPDCSAAKLTEKLNELLKDIAEADGRICPDESRMMNKVRRLIEAGAMTEEAGAMTAASPLPIWLTTVAWRGWRRP